MYITTYRTALRRAPCSSLLLKSQFNKENKLKREASNWVCKDGWGCNHTHTTRAHAPDEAMPLLRLSPRVASVSLSVSLSVSEHAYQQIQTHIGPLRVVSSRGRHRRCCAGTAYGSPRCSRTSSSCSSSRWPWTAGTESGLLSSSSQVRLYQPRWSRGPASVQPLQSRRADHSRVLLGSGRLRADRVLRPAADAAVCGLSWAGPQPEHCDVRRADAQL